MNNEQRLYPLRIYQINQALEEFKRVCGIGEAQLINFGVLDYKNRKFNWTVVHNKRWNFNDNIIKNIKNFYSNDKNCLGRFLEKVEDKSKDFDIIKESVKEARNILQSEGGNNELHYHLLNLYHFYPHESDLFADGIIYRNFIKRSKRLLYATGELLIEKKEYGLKGKANIPYSLYPWIDMTFVYDGGEKVRSFSCQEDKKDIEYTQANRDKKLREASKPSFPLTPDQNIYFKYLTPLFTGYKDSNTDEPYKGESLLDEGSLKQSIAAFKYMLYIPVYDASIGRQLYGNFCGNISIPFAFKEDMEEFKNRYLDRILENAYLLMRATTPLHEILKQRMEERNLLEHFVKYITMVQDWERVMVWKKGEEKRVSYCYKRENGDSWVECVADINNENCKKCKSYYDDLKSWVQKSNNCHLATDEEAFKIKHSKRKILLESIFTKKFIPELRDETRYSDIALVFEYPPYTIFPSGESTTHKLGISYERQHVEILRQMYSQEARIKHATQTAITAIIARNHSHHIGSHVIPRTSVALLKERLQHLQNKEKLNGNCDFIKIIDILKTRLDEYIQKKADFMAEVATEPLISTKNIAFLRGIIRFFATNTLIMDNLCDSEGLGYPKSDDNYDNLECNLKIVPMHNGKVLDANFTCLSCGKNGKFKLSDYPYTATCGDHSYSNGRFYGELQWGGQIKNGNGSFDDFEIAVPGPLGEYALYCFLENFIRNSAKHNRDGLQDGLNIYINVSEIEDADINIKNSNGFFKKEDKDVFYKVEIWDNVTKPDKEATGEDGKKKILENFLNEKIQQSIINDDLSIRKGAWGIAEMKIMATLLKGSVNFVRMAENLKVVKSDKNGENILVYTFKMMRSKKVAFLISNPPDGYNNHKKEGIWWFKSPEEFKDHIQNGKSIAAFEFVVIDNDSSGKINGMEENGRKEFSALLPFRVLVEGNTSLIKGAISINNAFINGLENINTNRIYQAVWKECIEHMRNFRNIENNLSLLVYLSQEKDVSPTKEWIDYQNGGNINLIACAKDNWNNITNKIQNNVKMMVYDRHFDAYRKALNKDKDPIIFHEIIEKNSSDFIHIFSKPEAETIYGMIEASLLNVLIMDERVAERVHDEIITGDVDDVKNAEKLYGSGKRIHTAEKAGIFICTHIDKGNGKEDPIHENLNSKFPRIVVKLNNGKCFEKIYWKENENGNNKKELVPHLLIIHQGIMEDFLKIPVISGFIDNLREFIHYIVIDSGRGIPPGLPSTEKFIPFSLLEDWVMKERISKYSLVRFLMRLNRRRVL